MLGGYPCGGLTDTKYKVNHAAECTGPEGNQSRKLGPPTAKVIDLEKYADVYRQIIKLVAKIKI